MYFSSSTYIQDIDDVWTFDYAKGQVPARTPQGYHNQQGLGAALGQKPQTGAPLARPKSIFIFQIAKGTS